MTGKLGEILRRRELIRNLVSRQLKVRYKSSFLGFLWSLFHPFFMMLIYWVVFTSIWRRFGDLDFKAYLICGLFPWYLFAGSLSDSVNSIVGNVSLVKKVYFPRAILPLAAVLTNLVNFLLSLIIMFVMLAIWKTPFLGRNLVFLPLIIVTELLLALGFAFLLAALNVFYRDTEHMLQVILFGWFFMTPAMYPFRDLIPEVYHGYYLLNPMAAVINAYQDVLYRGTAPDMETLMLALQLSVVLVVAGYLYLSRSEARIADQL